MLEPLGYMAMGNGTNIVSAPFRCEEGGHQGAVETGFLFSLAIHIALKKFNDSLASVGGGVTAIMDDTYAMGPPRELFAANAQFAIDLAEVGLESQPAKAKCYIEETHRNTEWHALRGDIPEGILKTLAGDAILGSNGERLRGIDVCNIPVGTRQYVDKSLEVRLEKIVKSYQGSQ